MSPEQARFKGHHVDGRSDLFSLGVVLYELLTGNRPFGGRDLYELRAQILRRDPKPPRQWNESIPAAIESICLKALAKSPADRYPTAYDFAKDLRSALLPAGDQQRSQQVQLEASLLHLVWDSLDPQLQDAFALAYNKKRRQGKDRISTRDLFEALVRVADDQFFQLQRTLPEGSLPEPIDPSVSTDRHVLEERPLLSDCVAESLSRYRMLETLPRKISCADIFVDIGKHGHGPSVVRLREHGVTPAELERHVAALHLSLIRAEPE